MRRGETEAMDGLQSKPRRRVLGALATAGAGALMPGAASAAGAIVERSIPSAGEKLPAIGMGSWQSFDVAGDAAGRAAAQEVLRLFVERGGRLVDSSPVYGDRICGARSFPCERPLPRPEIEVASQLTAW